MLDHVGAIRVPTLIVVGDEDVPCPLSHGEELKSAIPGARLTRIPAAGHTMTAERPEACAEVIAGFLADTRT